MDYKQFRAPEGKQIKLADLDANFTGDFKNKKEAAEYLEKQRERIIHLQEILYAENTQGLVVIFQAMDAAGKDSTIKHVFTGVNPLGIQVSGFKAPSEEELDHDYLWRAVKLLPERGKIAAFSRSYYEEVLAVRVRPEILAGQQLPGSIKNDPKIWEKRLTDIRHFEHYLSHNGFHVLKFFLLTSKEEQKKQFMERIEDPAKYWKFAASDLADRKLWDDYMSAYEAAFAATSTDFAPWYVVPGDKRWFTRAVIGQIVADKLESLNPAYPAVSEKQKQAIEAARTALESEK
jgi:PPK2 family polyphosphate:nucleotide phosphotransferase